MTQSSRIMADLKFAEEQRRMAEELDVTSMLRLEGVDQPSKNDGQLVEFESEHPEKPKGYFPEQVGFIFANKIGFTFYERLRPVFDEEERLISVIYGSSGDEILHIVVD